jgi:predicted dehydrogenase
MSTLAALIIGVGSIGERHARCFLATRRARVGIFDTNVRLRADVAARYQLEQFDTLDAAVAWRPALAVVCTPAHLHVPMARRLVEAGVHTLIEKPLSTSLEGVAALRGAILSRGATAGVAYIYRMFPELAAMRQAIVAGRFGRPLELVAVSGQHFPTYRPAYRHLYYARHETGGGAIQDALTHVVNAAEWLVGPVDCLAADAGRLKLEGVEVEDTVHLLARHGSVRAVYALNQHQAPNEMTLTVVCQQGTARCQIHEQCWQWMVQPGGAWQTQAFGPRERDEPFIAQAHAFMDSIERGEPFVCPVEDGIQTLRVNLAALASAREGRWVSSAEVV